MKTEYKTKVEHNIECIKFEEEAYNGGELPTQIDGVEYDGLGFSEESNVIDVGCKECGELHSEKQMFIYKSHSQVREDLCFNCHSHRTENLTEEEMAEILMKELGWKDWDAKWTFENQFKRRSDLAYILMMANSDYNAEM